MLKKSLLALLPLAILAGGWYFVQQEKQVIPDPITSNSDDVKADSTSSPVTNPLATSEPATAPQDDATLIVEAIKNQSGATASSASNASTTTYNTNENGTTPYSSTQNEPVDAASVAVEPLSDEEFIRLEQQIKTDKQLRMQLLDEFRYNTDPERAQQLAALLGPYNDPAIVQTASELAYSGDLPSQIAGLDLLSRIQPRSDIARNVAIDLLSSGAEPTILIATMNVLATPARTANSQQRTLLNDNLYNLSNHSDSRVRAHSMSLMGRWDKNSAMARESLTRGITDPDPAVRSSAAYAITNIANPDDAMIEGLLAIAENTTESKATRYAALSALEKMQLGGTHLRRYSTAKRNVNRRN